MKPLLTRCFSRWFLYVCLLLVGLGCSQKQPKPYPVEGQILYQNQPLAEAFITFYPQNVPELGRNLVVTTDSLGNFSLSTFKTNDGALPGEYRVTVVYRELIPHGDERARLGRNLLPARYAKPETSELRCTIEKKANRLAPFELSR